VQHNNDVVCVSKPTYGTRAGVAGNELGYITALSYCHYNSTYILQKGAVLSVERYDPTAITAWGSLHLAALVPQSSALHAIWADESKYLSCVADAGGTADLKQTPDFNLLN